MDETYIKVKSQWKYRYRAVDNEGKTIDFLLRAKRDKAAAMHFFEQAMQDNGIPEKVTMDKRRCQQDSRRSAHRRPEAFNPGSSGQVPEQHQGQMMIAGSDRMSFADQFYALAGQMRTA